MLRVGEPHKQSGFGQFFLVATWVMEERLVFAAKYKRRVSAQLEGILGTMAGLARTARPQ